jgi:hypothetical protein
MVDLGQGMSIVPSSVAVVPDALVTVDIVCHEGEDVQVVGLMHDDIRTACELADLAVEAKEGCSDIHPGSEVIDVAVHMHAKGEQVDIRPTLIALPGSVLKEDIKVDMLKLLWPVVRRSMTISFSLVAQIDGLLAKCWGMGARITRDVFAESDTDSVCEVRGYSEWMSTGSFCGFYYCDFEFMPHVVASVLSHKGFGVFVVPVMPGALPTLAVLQKNEDESGQWSRYYWYDFLLSKSLLVFNLPADGFFVKGCGRIYRPPFGVQAIFAQFGSNGHFKAIPRKERMFSLSVVPQVLGPKLGVRPFLAHRVSPRCWDAGPLPSADVAPASPIFVVPPGIVAPVALPSRWVGSLPLFEQVAKDFPCRSVAALGLECMSTGLNPFKGSLSKSVVHVNRKVHDEASELVKRETLMKEVDLPEPRIAGPFKECPFPHARPCPTSTVPKDPYDPESTRQRLISNFSKRVKGVDGGSVNDLCWSPRLLSYHATPTHIRDTLAWLFLLYGAGIVAWSADIPSCFRLNYLHPKLLGLFVYMLQTLDFGKEWFVDLATPFGWTPSEWGWQCVLALLLWHLWKAGLWDVFAYVDNFFYLTHPKVHVGQGGYQAVFDRIEREFVRMGIPLHERMCGTLFNGLGWLWDTTPTDGPPCMVCPDDKYDHLCRQLLVWSQATSLVFPEVESIIGFMEWIAVGFPLGKPHIAHLRSELARHKAVEGRRLTERGVSEQRQMVRLGPYSIKAVKYWAEWFPQWDKRCPVFLGHGPMGPPEVLWRVDASTEWGMGAMMWVIGTNQGYYITHKWTQKEREEAFVTLRASTGVLEAMGAARCAKAFSVLSAGKRVLMEMDNDSVFKAIQKCYSGKPHIMKHVFFTCEKAAKAGVHLLVAHVKGGTRVCYVFHLS